MLWHIFISFLALCLTVGGQSIVVRTPIGVTNCTAAILSWSNSSSPPYNILIESTGTIDPKQKLIAYNTSDTTTVVWNVDIPTNLSSEIFYVWVSDQLGGYGQSNSFTVAPGTCPSASTTQSQTTAQETSTAPTGVQNAPTGVIIGGVIGGVLVLTIVIGFTLWYRRKRNRHPTKDEGVVHVSEVGITSALPERLENDILERSSGRPPPWAVPLGPSTTANEPITNSSERALPSSNPSQQASSSWKFSPDPPSDSLVLGPERHSSSIPPQAIENDLSHPAPAYHPAPQSPDLFRVPFSPPPPTYFTIDRTPPQDNLPEFDPSVAQNLVERNLTDGDVEAIARRLMEMQRDQRS